MKSQNLSEFKEWFSAYCRTYYQADPEDQKNIALKEEHTFKVCENMREITRRLGMVQDRMLLAETIALFHDIGRFPQYAQYRTFRDSISVNHGRLGSQILVREKVLRDLPSTEQHVIIKSVNFHNAFAVPAAEEADTIFFVRLIRDADKLDIWRVFLEFYECPEQARPSAVGLGLPANTGFSDDVLASFYRKKIISLSGIRTLDDFKILQLSWVFDLNFRPSLELLEERGYVERVAAHLPGKERIRILGLLKEYVGEKLSAHSQLQSVERTES